MTLGLVCDACDALSPVTVSACAACGKALGLASTRSQPVQPERAEEAAPAAGSPPPVVPMRACPTCGTPMPSSHRYCGSCGGRLEPQSHPGSTGKTQFFSAMQETGRAKLILIRGEGMDGISYVLASAEHVVGREQGEILFPDDALLSPKHANFLYRNGELYVRDEGSRNGVFLRIKEPQDLEPGQPFLVGEQLLSMASVPPSAVAADAEGTFFYGSPRRSRMSLVQLLAGGAVGMVVHAHSDSLSVGREGNDVNFPDDPFISGRHAHVAALASGRFRLTDTGSKNGTYVRVMSEARLMHGDYLFLGQQLLRVEIT
jgi:pSer/pThr/pTyr-binding forkhead associated (FHA) protein